MNAEETVARISESRSHAFIASFVAIISAALLAVESSALADDPSAEVIALRRCPISYQRSTGVGSTLHGVLHDCLVEPGDRVKAGQILGRLQDDDVRAELQLREKDALSDVEIRVFEAKKLQALSKLKTTGVLVRRNAANAEEYNLHRLEAEVADLEVEQAKHRHEIAQIYYRRAKEVVHAREFIAPHDGVVIVVLKHKGEPVQPNEPLFRVVDPDRLEVTGQADVTDVWRLQIGQPVRVIPDVAGADLPVEHEEFLGRLVFIDTQIDPLTRTCKVVARIDNRGGLLRSGMEARLEILPVRGNEVPPDAGPERAPRGPLQVPPSRFGNRDRVGTLNLQ